MVAIKIKGTTKQAKAVIEMLKTFSFVEFESASLKRPTVLVKKNKLMQDVETSLKQLKLKNQGKLKFNTVDILLNEK